MRLNLDGFDDELQTGSYIGIVKDINFKIDEKKGTALVSFSVLIDGVERRSKLYQTEGKGRGFLKKALKNLGIDVPKGDFETDDLPIKGSKAEFAVVERTYEGKTFKDLEPVKPLGRATDAESLQLESVPF